MYLNRTKLSGRIDSKLEKQLTETRDYWKNVLRRIIETILFLSGRGLPFRGSDEHFGSNHNGNYLGILELLSKFDPFLAQHIAVHGNQGKGHTSYYLSKTICNEFIALIANKTRTMNIDQLKKAGYFSISVDFTPDITHMDQLTIILKYVNNDGPVERFITFIHITSHTGANLALCLLNFLKENDINIENCRGQSYDNASNMSGTYTGMQAEIKKCNSLIDYIPCIAHSLNIVGQSAVDCCVEAVSFFVTRWSANAEAVKALFLSYENINEALRKIQNDTLQKQSTRHQASCLSSILGHLETGIMCELWHNILEPFNKCSKSIQSGIIDLYTEINLIESLKIVLQNIRNQYDEYESNGMKRAKNEDYKLTRHRKKFKRNESSFNELNAKESFKINTSYVIIDQLYSVLVHRINAYTTVRDNFKLLSDISMNMQIEDIEGGMKKLLERYPKDFPDDFTNELVFRQRLYH
ncbi:PREDICTED: zinc finger MYM-type protein 1-like [Diuraphis noxia]|uniref:zinc finger MYM-type protein 1-like n=1 Tax=Diuraphis noxia TaxID=143948 RepID=UPI0007635A66|nr:PREDICTED: zinc finger MYM-type protein 1-like [Diuraphis noxia]